MPAQRRCAENLNWHDLVSIKNNSSAGARRKCAATENCGLHSLPHEQQLHVFLWRQAPSSWFSILLICWLVQALRLYLSHGAGRGAGWLFALGDPRIAAAVEAIHARPDARWTLPALAEKPGMSRSKSVARLKTVSGSFPIDHLKHWRMLLACERLIRRNEPVSAIALSLGYDAEAAFSTAFKRVMGCAPRTYAKRG